VLREMGSNIEYATAYFPGRSRAQLKRKFKIEDARDKDRIDWCLANQREVGESCASTGDWS
jgi:hypothetical protein